MVGNRTVAVTLQLQAQQYIDGWNKAAAATKRAALESTNAVEAFRKHNEALTKVGTAFTLVGATTAAGLAIAIRASAEYGAKMAQLQSLSHASAEQMQQLSHAAMTVGQAYGFSATQVADAEIELTKAGVGVKAQLGGALVGALQLAAAGQIDVGRATEIATVAMTQFGLKAGDVPHLADLLSAGADKALGSVGDLGEALANGGLQAHNMGLSIEDTVGLLSAFANAGILGAEAGTQMRSMFIQLQRPTKQAQDELDKYGIALSDSKGNFVGVTALAGELHDKLGGLTQAQRNAALATIFGSHAITGATVLYQDGAKGIAGWIKGVNDSGFASAQAAGKLNSLQGDVQKLSAAFQTDLIKAGTSADGPLRTIVQDATKAVTALGDLPGPAQSVGVAVVAVTAGVGLFGGALLLAVPKIAEFKLALKELDVTGSQVGRAFGKGSALLLGITAIAGGLSNLGSVGMASSQQVNYAATSMSKKFGDLNKLFSSNGASWFSGATDAASALKASFSGNFWENGGQFTRFFDGLTLGITHFSDVFKTNEGQFAALGEQLAGLSKQNYSAAASSFNVLVQKLGGGKEAVRELLLAMPAYREQLVALAGKAHVQANEQNLANLAQNKGAVSARVAAVAQAESAAAAAKNAAELAKLTGSGDDATQSMKDLHDALANLGSTELDARSAARGFQQAIDDATKAAKTNGRTLDINTQAGRDNSDALDGIAKAADESAAAYVKNGGSAAGAAKIIANGRQAFIDSAVAMGLSKKRANELADSLHLIPKDVSTAVNLTGANSAITAIRLTKEALATLNGRTANVAVHYAQTGATQAIGGARFGFAEGGMMPNIGPKGKDSFLIAAGAGEFMFPSRTVDKAGGPGAMYAIDRAIRAGTLSGYASGGEIGATQAEIAAQQRQVEKDRKALNHAKSEAAAAKSRGAKRSAESWSAEAERFKKLVDDEEAGLKNLRASLTSLRQGREDFVSGQRRGVTDPLTYVDQLRSMSRDDNFSRSRRASFDRAANQYESAIVKLAKRSDDAATKLNDLKSSADQMRSSIKAAIAGGYQATGAASVQSAGGWIMQGGIRFQTTTTGTTAGSLASYYSGGAKDVSTFASQLKQLAARKVNGQLLAEIAGYGVQQGGPIAAALLSASDGQIASINRDYGAIQSAAGAAAGTVADDNYQTLIEAAQKQSDALLKQLADDGDKLRKLIARAFGLKGYAAGTGSAAPGLAWVGENGPELVRFSGGEQVRPNHWVRSQQYGPGGAGAVRVQVAMPKSMNLVDGDGALIGRVRVEARGIARQEIAADAAQDYVLEYGGGA